MTGKRFVIFIALFGLLNVFCYFYIDPNFAINTQAIRRDYYVLLKILSILFSPPTLLFIFPTLFFSALFIQKSKKQALWLYPLVASLIYTNAIIRVIKLTIGRSRPDYFLMESIYRFDFFSFDRNFSSFPSGHSATLACFIGYLACKYPRHALSILAGGMLLSTVRAFIGAHYISDVLTGDFLGFYITWLIFYRFNNSTAYLDYMSCKTQSEKDSDLIHKSS